MTQDEQAAQLEFEEEVRTVARALWPSARYGGVENIENVEHDAVYFTFDTVQCIEATVSRTVKKAEHDGNKLKKAINKWTGTDDRLAKGWFITKYDPTPEQTKAIKKIDPRITAISFRRFKARLFDIHRYHQLRVNAHFGSAANPAIDDETFEHYVPVDFALLDETEERKTISFSQVLDDVAKGHRFAVVGDYGIGKSMNLRELYMRLVSASMSDRSINAPVHINLRDHWGQRSPSAALTQHAEDIGYGSSEQLIAAWRAGFVHILLDGFDEVAAPGWSGDIASLRSTRRRAVELVRQFISQTPKGAAVVVAGRRHYFDSLPELQEAMFGSHAHTLLELSEFTEEQVAEYLQSWSIKNIPHWLPLRPLLLGHLASRKIFGLDLHEATQGMSQAESWDWLLDKISAREAEIEAGLSGNVVREIIERLASLARKGTSGVGPISQREIRDVFVKLRGQEPSDSEQAILQRLPGLARDPDFEEGSRSFIDADFASVAQARDMSNYALNPYQDIHEQAHSWAAALSGLGIDVAAYQYTKIAPNNGQLMHAHKNASRHDLYVAQADLVRMSIELGYSPSESVYVDSVHIPSLALPDDLPDLKDVTFSNCLFDRIDFGGNVDPLSVPSFNNCYVHAIYGRLTRSDLPDGKFSDTCDIDEYPDAMERNAAVANSDLPAGVRVVLIVLRKLYMQPGRGRLESALSRGLPQEERQRVAGCLSILQKENMATMVRVKSRTIWTPNRAAQQRAFRFIEAPRGSGDPLYMLASSL